MSRDEQCVNERIEIFQEVLSAFAGFVVEAQSREPDHAFVSAQIERILALAHDAPNLKLSMRSNQGQVAELRMSLTLKED